MFRCALGATSYTFATLRELLAKATPTRSGDRLAGLAAATAEEAVAARLALADLPLQHFLSETLIPYEADEVTRLIVDSHDAAAFAPVAALTVGAFREWLLQETTTGAMILNVSPGLTPEMVAAVSKLMRNQDLIAVSRKIEVVRHFRNTIGLSGRMSVRLQPNHPADEPRAIAAAILDGLVMGCGDACIGINPASDDPAVIADLWRLLDQVISRLNIPTQSCILSHVTTTIGLIEQGLPGTLAFGFFK